MGGPKVSGDRRNRRGTPDRDDLAARLLPAASRRSFACRSRAARNPRPHPPHDGRIQFRRPVSAIPGATGRGLVKAEWVKRYRENDQPEHFDRIVQSWDTANKATELSDFSVCTTWGVKGKHLFLIGLFRRRLE